MPRFPPQRRAGEPLRAPDYNSIVQAAVTVFNTAAGPGIKATITPRGLTLAAREQVFEFKEPAQTAEAQNIGASDLGVFDAVMITLPTQCQSPGYQNAQYPGQPWAEPDLWTHRTLQVQLPTDHFFGRFGICAQKIKVGEIGWVWISGVCLCYLYRVAPLRWYVPGFKTYDRADTYAGSGKLQMFSVGAAQVLWTDPYSYAIPDTWHPAVIRFDHRQTPGVGHQQRGSLLNSGNLEVLELDDSVMVVPDANGVVVVELH